MSKHPKIDVAGLSADERKKLIELLNEEKAANEGQDSSKLQWMYKKRSMEDDREDYLLGKRIDDKVFQKDESPPSLGQPDSSAHLEQAISRHAALDMQAKMREDPLFLIKQKEQEARRRILAHPTNRKKLKLAQMAQQADNSRPSHPANSSSSTSSSDDDEGDDLLKKFLEIRHAAATLERSKPAQLQTSDERKDSAKRKQKHKHKRRSESASSDASSSDQRHSKSKPVVQEQGAPHRSHYGNGHRDKPATRNEAHSYKKRSYSRSRSRSAERMAYKHSRGVSDKGAFERDGRERRQFNDERKKRADDGGKRPDTKAKDRQKALEEMLANANWREQHRQTNVRSGREQDAAEDADLAEQRMRHSAAGFVNRMMSDHAAQSTVAERIQRNKFSIQRTGASLDKKFIDR